MKKKKLNQYEKQALSYIRKYHNKFMEATDTEVKRLASLLRKQYNRGFDDAVRK